MKARRKTVSFENPWIIVHQPGGDGNPIRTILAGRNGAKFEEFALIVCDVVRNIALGFHVSEDQVFEWVEKERRKPTTVIETTWERPTGRA